MPRHLLAVTTLLLTSAVRAQEPAPAEAPPGEAASASPASAKKVSADDCVAIALRESGIVGEAKGKVTEWQGRLAEVQSVWFPKLSGLGYVAPLYRLRSGFTDDVQRDFTSWGPYVHLQAVLAQPIYTFGRASAGEDAATQRMEVEEARYQQTRNVVALEVRKFYYLHLYAKSFLPALSSAKRILDEAEETAKKMYAERSGKVTNVDLMKLRYGQTELAKFIIQAEMGTDLSLAALKHTMGLPQTEAIEPVDEALPEASNAPVPALAEYVKLAVENRPEVAQLRHGKQAALSFKEAERLSSMPAAFVAGQLDFNWTPMWPNQRNPFAYDRFNDITPGVAVGLQFDVDIAKSRARAAAAQGIVEQVEGLGKFAATGIPMEVRKAYDDLIQAQKLLALAQEGSTAGRKWMIFAGSAYVAGTGEAKDLLEGMVAYLGAKKGYYDNLQAYHVAKSTLVYVTGKTGVEGR